MPFTKDDPNINRKGRPKGPSIKEWIKKYLKKNPKEFRKLCKYYLTDKKMRDLLWKMIDGLPKQSIGFDTEDIITELSIKIKTQKDESQSGINNDISKESESIPDEKE